MDTALRILLILCIGCGISAMVAYLGNRLGRHVGRRKMTIFGLRPRYTSNIITLGTGSMIFLLTLALSAAASEQVRIFLGGLDDLLKQREVAVAQVEQLNKQAEELTRRIRSDTQKLVAGQLVAPYQPLAVGIVDCGVDKAQITEQLGTLLQLANEHLVLLNNRAARSIDLPPIPRDRKLVGYVIPEKDSLVEQLSREKGTRVCLVIATHQAFLEDKLICGFVTRDNPRIFEKGQVISSAHINGAEPVKTVTEAVSKFILKDLKAEVMYAGMLKNPLNDKLETSIDLAMIQRYADRIAKMRRTVELKVVAHNDIYPLGPLNVDLVVANN